ncbi:hypothetical protein V1524DRAFT_419231 [Lipomyces starkeyi]
MATDGELKPDYLSGSYDKEEYSIDKEKRKRRKEKRENTNERPHSLPGPSLTDEDVKNKCIEFFRTTSLNSRSAVRLKEYYEDVIFPKSTGQLGRPTIGLTTCIRYLREWGFDKRYHQQDVYYDGHEREDRCIPQRLGIQDDAVQNPNERF